MKKSIKWTFILLFFLFEGGIAFFAGTYYEQYTNFNDTLKENQGLTQACRNIALSSHDLLSALAELDHFVPEVFLFRNRVFLSYGTDRAHAPGVALVFDENYKLSHKSCNDDWEPEVPGGSILDFMKEE